ncbi:MAG: taurine ABC transporter substrate-binding protein, partial [Alcaligenaceae bacterium]
MTLNRRTFLNVLAASTVAAGSTATTRLFAAEVPLKKVRYGGSAWLGHYPAFLAMEYGYFKEAGIEQDWQNFRSTSSRMAAFM